MAGQKQIGWKKLFAAVVFALLFLATNILVHVPKVAAAEGTFNWVDIATVEGPGGLYGCKQDGDKRYTCTQNGIAVCPATLIVNTAANKGNYTIYGETQIGSGQCKATEATEQVDIGAPEKAPQDLEGSTRPSDDAVDGSATVDPNLDCKVGPSPLTWILCPVIKGINVVLNALDNAIYALLTIDQKAIFDTNTPSGQSYYTAWQTFRGFGLAVLIIAGLMMVISQALGWQVFDAYTIKKVMPRLLIAIIMIALSWKIMEFFVTLTNDLGAGIRYILTYPFRGFNQSVILDGGGEAILTLLGGGAILALQIGGLLSFAGTALLAIGIAFLVLILRQLVVIMLVLFAPIAIACSVLPNTQGAYKLWYESFTKAMMMFPIIVAFLTLGKVFAVATIGANAGEVIKPISQIMALVAYIIPYFLIPLTFKLAGGALRVLGGSINDRNRGAFDRLKKYRGGKIADSMHGLKEGTRFKNNNALSRGFNRTSAGIASARHAGLNPYNWRSNMGAAHNEEVLSSIKDIRESSAFIAGGNDDSVLRAAAHGRGRAGIAQYLRENEGITDEARLRSMTGIAERMQNAGPREAVQAAIALQRFATGTGYTRTDENGREYFDYDDAIGSLRDASGGDRELAGSLLGQAKGIAAGAGQTAFGGASYGTLNTQLNRAFAGEAVQGNAIALNAHDSVDAATQARARGVHLRDMTEAGADRMTAIAAGTAENVQPGELGRRTGQMESLRQAVSMYGANDRQNIVNTEFGRVENIMEGVRQSAGAAYAPQQQAPAAPVIVLPPAGGGAPAAQPQAPIQVQAPAPAQQPLIAVGNWNPGMPLPTQSDPQFRQAPAQPREATDNDRQYMATRGGRPNPNDVRTREQMNPEERQ